MAESHDGLWAVREKGISGQVGELIFDRYYNIYIDRVSDAIISIFMERAMLNLPPPCTSMCRTTISTKQTPITYA